MVAPLIRDLGIALAIASSRLDKAVPPDTAAVGEIGLGGEVRRISRLDVRLAEATRLGFKRLLVPAVCHREHMDRVLGDGDSSKRSRAGKNQCELVPVSDVAQAIDWLIQNGLEGGP